MDEGEAGRIWDDPLKELAPRNGAEVAKEAALPPVWLTNGTGADVPKSALGEGRFCAAAIREVGLEPSRETLI